MAYAAKKYISVEEYFLLEEAAPEKHEYINGDVLAMAGATEEHNDIVSNLIREVGNCLKGKGYHIYPSRMRLATPVARGYFYPDVTIVQGKAQLQEGVFDTLVNPLIIIEVMSEESLQIDKGYKFFYYRHIASLQEYIVIDSTQFAVDIIRRQTSDTWSFEKVSCHDNHLRLNAIGCTVSFNDLYDRMNFANTEFIA